MRQSLYEFCKVNQKQILLQEWDTERNLPYTPESVTYGSHIRAWWQCENGHSWQTFVYIRSGGSKCPYCTGRKVAAGYNDLAFLQPELAKQWDFEKNIPLVPSDVSSGSQRSVWWRCEHGHSWRALIRSRVSGNGCPICAGKKLSKGENDLASSYPELIAQWDYERNGDLLPQNIMSGTVKKVWWRCEYGHGWSAAVSSRTHVGSGCPYCSGRKILPGFNDLATREPELARQWDAEKNGELTPERVARSSNRKVWWRCEKGHSFQAVIASRTNGSGCPYCTGRKVLRGFNDLATLEPSIAAEWHAELNGNLTADMVTVGSHKKIWWECADGHVWKAVVHSRTGKNRCGCPICSGKTRAAKRRKQYD